MPSPLVHIPYERGKGRLHQKILGGVLARHDLCKKYRDNRNRSYKEMEDQFLAYLPEKSVDANRRLARELEGVPAYTTVQIPYSYAEVMTTHTYYSTVMLGRKPILQYNGRHGEGQKQKLAVEAIMNYQMVSGANAVPMYIWLLDGLKYGRGILGTFWDEQYSYFTQIQDRNISAGPLTIKRQRRMVQERILQYMGNRFYTVRPQQFIFDPRVPTAYLQDGEFVGREFKIPWNALVRGEQEGRYFNVKEARQFLRGVTQESRDVSQKIDLPVDGEVISEPKDIGEVDAIELTVEIIPREWEVADTNRPQKWRFTVVAKQLLIEVRPMGAYHDQFEFFSVEPEFDGYSLHSRSGPEVIKPLEDVLTWLFNTHFYNVRAALNDQYVLDPSRIEINDVLNPLPGGAVRAKPEAYGTNLRDAIFQLPIRDVTQQHIADAGHVLDILQRVDGVNDSIQGLIASGGRKTATEVRQSNTFGVSRLKVRSEMLAAMGLEKLAMVALQNTQQYYNQEMKFRIAGDLVKPGTEPFVDVSPEAIAGSYDFVPIDGSIPLDRFALASLWRQLTADLMRVPEVAQGMGIDIPAILFHTAKLAGATDIEQFQVQVRPDEELAREAERGNVVPLGPGGQGGTRRNPQETEGDERGTSRVVGAPQISGLGPSG